MGVPRPPDAVQVALTTQHLIAPLASDGLLEATAKAPGLQSECDSHCMSWTYHFMVTVAAVKQRSALSALRPPLKSGSKQRCRA